MKAGRDSIRAGNLDRRVTIQKPTVTTDSVGGHVETWTTMDTVWAGVRDLSGREIFAAQALGSAISKVVTIRFRSDIKNDMRLTLHDGKIAKISHTIEVGRSERLDIFCEVINDG